MVAGVKRSEVSVRAYPNSQARGGVRKVESKSHAANNGQVADLQVTHSYHITNGKLILGYV
jgi:hypothetical protein